MTMTGVKRMRGPEPGKAVENIGGRTALATARLTNAEGKLFAHATSNCLIFRPDQPGR
jgi:acyl-coenzyme A thioesterase PaaI-like protein